MSLFSKKNTIALNTYTSWSCNLISILKTMRRQIKIFRTINIKITINDIRMIMKSDQRHQKNNIFIKMLKLKYRMLFFPLLMRIGLSKSHFICIKMESNDSFYYSGILRSRGSMIGKKLNVHVNQTKHFSDRQKLNS